MMTGKYVASPWGKLIAPLFPSWAKLIASLFPSQMQLGSPRWRNDSRCNRTPAPVRCALAEFQII
jgi:hypothetical protein